jgi:hypothetical protein
MVIIIMTNHNTAITFAGKATFPDVVATQAFYIAVTTV